MKRNKVNKTPEQVEAEQTVRLAEYKRQEEAKAARKAQQREDYQHTHCKLLDFAICMKNVRQVEAGKAAEVDCDVRNDIGRDWLSVNEELTERAYRMLSNPASYFEWSETDMKLACKREMLDSIIWAVQANKLTLLQILSNFRADLVERIINNYDRPSSTSAAHNATMVYKLEARADFVRYNLDGWIRQLSNAKPTAEITQPC